MKRSKNKLTTEQRKAGRQQRRHMAMELIRLDFGGHYNQAHIFDPSRRDHQARAEGINPKKVSMARRVRPHYHRKKGSYTSVRDDGAHVERVLPNSLR
jgi:hypothetical protein